MKIAQLAEIIRKNPNCLVTVDNDYWWIDKQSRAEYPGSEDDDEAFAAWDAQNRLVCADDITEYHNGYGSGSSYGGDVLQALALLQGIRVESV